MNCSTIQTPRNRKAIKLPIPHLHHSIKITSLKKRIELQVTRSLPMLTAKRSVGKLHVVGCLYMCIRKSKCLIVPGIIGILVSRTQIDHLGLTLRLPQTPLHQHIVSYTLKYDRYRLREILLRIPT